MAIRGLAAAMLGCWLVAAAATAVAAESGLPLPRFASLKSDRVNLRAGPGTQYPVAWVLTHKAMPVEITAEYEGWRRIRDASGTEGWVQHSLLSGRRSVLVTADRARLMRDPEAESYPLAIAESGAQGRLFKCKGEWCQVKLAQATGWIPRHALWGIYPDEVVK